MRGFCSSASRGLAPLAKPRNPTITGKNPSFPVSQFKNRNLDSVPAAPIDHQYFAKILGRKDWYLLLRQELKAKRVHLSPQSIISVLQNQENPLHPLRFYVWVLSISPSFAKNREIRGVLSNALYRKGPVLLSVELVQDVRNSGSRITEDLLCVMIGSWGRLGLAKYCVEVFEQVSYLGISPSTRLYNAVLDALVKANSLDLAYLKYQQMQVDGCEPDRFTFNILMHGVCKVGVVDEALRLLKQMEAVGYLPNVFSYTILIDGFCNAKRVDEAFSTLERMKERNVVPNDATFRSLVNGVFRSVPPREAFELLSSWLDRQVVLPKVYCDAILCSLSDHSLSRELVSFLIKVWEKGYISNSSILNITMGCLIKEVDPEEFCEVLDAFVKRGTKVELTTYLEVIKALFRVGYEDKGNHYLAKMLEDGLVSNVAGYNMLIDCFCKAKMIQQASQAFGEMYKRGIRFNLITINTLLDGFYKAGNVDEAQELLLLLLENGFKPDSYTFSSIIDGLCRTNRIGDAFECFSEMVEWGVTPNAVTYNILIRWLCVIGDIPKAMSLLKKMQRDGIKPDVLSFNSLIQSFCRTNKTEKAARLLISMLSMDLSPDIFTYTAFIKALCESDRVDEAKALFHFMETNGCGPDAYVCNLFIENLVKIFRFQDAREIYSKYKERGMALNPIGV